jgi:hypothetical protein
LHIVPSFALLHLCLVMAYDDMYILCQRSRTVDDSRTLIAHLGRFLKLYFMPHGC